MGGHKFGPKGPKSCLNLDFCYFFKFGSLVFLEIGYSDSLQQYVTCNRGRTHKKGLGAKFGANRPNVSKSAPKLGFLSFFKFGSLVFQEIAWNIV